ncbi:MAG: glyoxylate/hydroxypyruvate reductase A [Bradyrhizobiaceae bacterium]|nr:glyoxylate/hydroxypyruvate reductase A [Bradyrhizobiaceae bacterium]
MTRDALIFYSAFDDPEAWQQALTAELPDLDVRVHPDIGDPSEVCYALVWKPPAGFFAGFPNLKLVTNLGAGIDSLLGRDDLPSVPISRLSDPGMVALMTSYVMFAVIRYARDIPIFERAQRQRWWHYVHPRALSAIKVGVLGLGVLGAPAASALAAVGFSVRGWSRTPKNLPGVTCVAGRASLDDFLADTEILVVMLPLTLETNGLLGEGELARLPKGAKLINVSRGAVIDETALIEALRNEQVAEATLDVFAVEPLPSDHVLWSMDNVLITPHLASITVPEAAAHDVAESIRRVRVGLPPLHLTDPRRGY